MNIYVVTVLSFFLFFFLGYWTKFVKCKLVSIEIVCVLAQKRNLIKSLNTIRSVVLVCQVLNANEWAISYNRLWDN